ncbi:MAG: PEGA domain-containing protein [Kofleriaceae bacterium]
MAKTESTAVNKLIELMQTQTPLPADPSEDLMFSTPKKVSAARMTSSVPPAHSAGDVAPLPRTRAPQGTQRLPTAAPPIPANVRVSTAPLSRTLTIPPLNAAITAKPPATLPPPVRRSSPPIAVSTSVEPADSLIRTTQNLGGDLNASMRLAAAQQQTFTTTTLGRQVHAPQPLLSPSPSATLMGQAPVVIAKGSLVPQQHPIVAPPPPPEMPVAAPFSRKSAPPMSTPLAYPSAQPYLQHLQPDMTSNQEWFDDAALEPEVEHQIGTARVPKQADWKLLVPKLIAPMVVLVIIGVFVGGYFAFDGDGGKKRTEAVAAAAPVATAPVVAAAEPVKPAPVAAAEPAKPETQTEPAAEPAKAEPVAAVEPTKAVTPPNLAGNFVGSPAAVVVPGRAALVDVRIDSTPAGATVMLVDRGKTTFLGTTPISTVVDPARTYDLVFTYANKPTQIQHLDPSTSKHLAVVLGKPATRVAARSVRAERKLETPKKLVKAEKADAPKVDTEPDKSVEAKKPAGEGTLMISSKPPCEIYIDGAPTGLTTPQRAIKLAAGKHKVTLVNMTEKIKKTVAVEVSADQPTKVIQDLMAK